MNAMNPELARHNMIEQQIRTWEVLDQHVLDLLAATPRELFVPDRYRNLAFTDVQIPLAHGEVMMQPKMEGRLLQTLAIQTGDRVLEIGTGSGYLTACLAKLARSVDSIEIHADLQDAAGKRLAELGIGNIKLTVGDAARGPLGVETYDVIAVTGSLPVYIEAFQQALNPGGRLFVIVGESPVMEASLIIRSGADSWSRESLFETDLPALVNAWRPQHFVL
jgi:protein-L-isoaspartate(D-aspartate) O-methyltransferase